ncbi:hypothetical protein GCM10023178_36420 [Actinomadura luteofluorescens]
MKPCSAKWAAAAADRTESGGRVTDHVGYDKHYASGRGSGNSRDGTRVKEVLTESADEASPAEDGGGEGHEGFMDVVADLPADA